MDLGLMTGSGADHNACLSGDGSGGSGGTLTNSGGTATGQTGGSGGALGSAGSLATGGASPDSLAASGTVGAAGACLVGKSFVNGGAGITGGTTGGGQT
jgi:hypothetical protein